MSDSLRDPPRWKDRTDQSDLAERAAGGAFRCASAEPRRSPPSLARVAARMRGARAPRRLTWALAATAFVLGLATAASAAHFNLLPSWLIDLMHPGSKSPAGESPRPRPGKRAKAPATTVAPPALPAPPTTEATPAPPVAEPPATTTPAAAEQPAIPSPPASRKLALAERAQRGPSSPVSSTTTAPPRPLAARDPTRRAPAPSTPSLAPSPWPGTAEPAPARPSHQPAPAIAPPQPATTAPAEAPPSTSPAQAPQAQGPGQYLTEAIHMLRKAHAPASALQLLDRHEPALAHAGFAHEALILRVEALLALDRRAEVLRLLDGASLTDVAASRALLVTRGELRAAANRCSDGMGDFQLVLARSRQPDRRALVGRALCRKRLGDLPGARADVQRLRDEFPDERIPAELDR